MKHTLLSLGTSLLWAYCLVAEEPTQLSALTASPTDIKLQGPASSYTILVQGTTTTGEIVDLTQQANYSSADPQIASVSATGFVRGRADGKTSLTIQALGKACTVTVQVAGSTEPRKLSFLSDVAPLLNRYGCNSSGCHGKAEGQNGFKLSVFGFDPQADWYAFTREARGRRLQLTAPDESLLLTKSSGRVAHGGGVRIPSGSLEYATLRAWIAAGAPFGSKDEPTVVSIQVEPTERVLRMSGQQQLRVLARYSDDRVVDVTPYARFQTNHEALAAVSSTGLVTVGQVPGDAAIMASFMNSVDTFRVLVPRSEKVANYPALTENNFIDKLIFTKLKKLHILPSELADEREFLRRVYLDIIGTLPTADEARRFLADKRDDKRAKLVDELLERPEYADFWALKWSDLLRVDRQALGHKRAQAYYEWIRTSFAKNKPFQEFTRELLLAEGPLSEVPAGSFYRVLPKSGEAASSFSQIFLGVRIACAECHHHPYDRWGQADYVGMQSFFSQVSVRTEVVHSSGEPMLKHPRTGETIHAHALGQPKPGSALTGDRRQVLADWLTQPDNPWFARNVANRLWAHFLGRGIVEPVDDVRDTNPPSNPELLTALAKEFVEKKYDLKQLIRTITASRVYQLSSQPNPTNEKDEQNYSRALLKRVDAEVLFDMVCQVSGVPEKFYGVPSGTRAVQLWDSKVSHYFLKLFGRPDRVSACECERNHEPGVGQVLHLLNSPEIHAKLGHEAGRLAKLVAKQSDNVKVIDEVYLTCLSRPPSEKELARAQHYFREQPDRRQAAEDLTWALLNSLEFLFNH